MSRLIHRVAPGIHRAAPRITRQTGHAQRLQQLPQQLRAPRRIRGVLRGLARRVPSQLQTSAAVGSVNAARGRASAAVKASAAVNVL